MRKLMFVTAILILLPSGGDAMAQGSGSSRVAPPPSSQSRSRNPAVPATPRPPTTAQFAASFWNYMNNPEKSYRQWGTPGKQKLAAVAGPSGKFHREIGQTYLNDTANNNLQQLPMGSVLVREEYGADGRTVENINVMYRAKMADPKNADWYWIMYRPDGSLATTSPDQGSRPIAGRVESCIQCHRQAGRADYVFLNDRPVPGAPKANPPREAPPSNPSGSGARR